MEWVYANCVQIAESLNAECAESVVDIPPASNAASGESDNVWQ